ncbi:signal peptidase I [Brevundimonas intermedia]|uniref:Signal peptidase I n=1 Tax=Brevundimonas intermedia TaxID=74315 RepID=A0ABQ5T6B0_9CAUL|nr:signal peptidase I [Brevundimonas intermedia]GLK47630.1 signal peptidase I [Brevundimonas intermedia]
MTHSPNAAAEAPPIASSLREIREIGVTLATALILAMAIRILLFQPFTIPSSSMEPGLVTGDYIVVSKYAYGWSRASLPFNPPLPDGRLLGGQPERGDVVVFRRPHDPDQVWIKRVIGLPGDTVQVRMGQVFVNGRMIRQTPLQMVSDHDAPQRRVLEVRETLASSKTYVAYDGGPDQPGDDTPIYRVPAGQYFMMGDNRDNSLDSRWPADLGVGLLPAGNIVGRAEIVAASWKPGAGLFKPWTWLNLQWGRFLKPIR